MEELLSSNTPSLLTAPSVSQLFIQILLATVLGIVVQVHFQKFGSTHSNREGLRFVLPAITLTTLLVISVVKSSLALSLGLVGALSIVRFRTPIKEPEELSYLFLSIGIGLGLGAGQLFITTVMTCVILLLVAFLKVYYRSRIMDSMHLSIVSANTKRIHPDDITEVLHLACDRVDLQRYGSQDGYQEFLYVIEFTDSSGLSKISDELEEKFDNLKITFVDSPRIPGL